MYFGYDPIVRNNQIARIIFLLAQLTANYRLRTDLQRFRGSIAVRDGCAEDHAASRGFLLASSLKQSSLLRESMLHVNVALLQDAHAIAGDVFGRIHVNLYYDRAINLPLDARR